MPDAQRVQMYINLSAMAGGDDDHIALEPMH